MTSSVGQSGRASVMLDLGFLCVVVVAAVLARPVLPPLDAILPAYSPGVVGLQGGWVVDDEGSVDFPGSVRSNLPLMKQAGAVAVRVHFRLGKHYADWTTKDARGLSALDQFDRVVNEARERYGLRVLGLISNESWPGGQSDWIANSAENAGGDGDNAYLRALSKQTSTLVEHFHGRVADWEIWNEPNCSTTFVDGQPRGGSFIYPSNFAQLLRHVYEYTRPVPEVRIVSGGVLAGEWDLPARGQARFDVLRGDSGGRYLAATYEQGRRLAGWEALRERYGTYPLDAIGLHLYVDVGEATTKGSVRSFLQEIRDSYVAYEGPGTAKKVVVTEFGWATSDVTEAVQAANLQIAYATFRETAYVGDAYWFVAEDNPRAGLLYGLRSAGASGRGVEGSAKLSLEAYREAAVYSPGFSLFGLQILPPSPLHYADGAAEAAG